MRRRVLVLIAAAGALLGACEGDPVRVPDEEAPFLYMVLGNRTVNHLRLGESAGQHGLLMTLPAPTEPALLRRAQRVEMRRARDGATFAWDTLHFPYADWGYPGHHLRISNLHLPDTTPDARLGAEKLAAGETYALLLETEGVTIRGSVTMPAQIEARLTSEGALGWSHVPGAVGYRVLAGTLMELTTDTVFRLTDSELDANSARVQALEGNAWDYFSDDGLGRAGIDTGSGVFGALTESRVEW